ncbi:MAG: ATP-binding cassette domain-containing protein, partial [Thermoplasmatales archaeon]
MIEKKVRCPQCSNIINSSGNPGEVVLVTCTSCGKRGKVTFEKAIESGDIAIEAINLKKVYGDLAAVDSISFHVNKGEVFAFLGPNGAGKTTTVEMIESIRVPTAGIIKILGEDISKSFDKVKDKIGI